MTTLAAPSFCLACNKLFVPENYESACGHEGHWYHDYCVDKSTILCPETACNKLISNYTCSASASYYLSEIVTKAVTATLGVGSILVFQESGLNLKSAILSSCCLLGAITINKVFFKIVRPAVIMTFSSIRHKAFAG